MSDNGGSFGEALESMTTNTKQAIGGTIADFGKSVKSQVAGNSQVSGSFTPGPFGSAQGKQVPQNPNAAPSLQGGDLFSPDMKGAQKPVQMPTNQQVQHIAGQMSQATETKTPEELEKMQKIKAELEQMTQTMHQKYYQDFASKAEGRDRKTQVEEQEKAQEEQQKEMQDLQKKEEKKQQDDESLKRAQRATEVKGGLG